ncbi:MAG TPA: CBS domain-containing protein [Bdellovibrionales bacterium]|nr:CBS domain-containing protein [Bdellovibrionales bacterium]
MITARDIMTRTPILVRMNDRLSKCMDIFIKNQLKFAPVIDMNQIVRGTLTEFSLIRLYTKHVMSGLDDAIGSHSEELGPVNSVNEKDSLSEVISAMKIALHERLIVLDDRRHLTGIISPYDVLTFLNQERLRHGTWEKMIAVYEIEAHQSILKKLERALKAA